MDEQRVGVPAREVGDRTERRPCREDLGMASQHEKRHVPAAGTADDVHARRVDLDVRLRVIHGVDDVLHRRVAAAGGRRLVRPAEVRAHHRPALRARILEHGRIVGCLPVVGAPGVEPHDQRHGVRLRLIRRPEVAWLQRAVERGLHLHEDSRPTGVRLGLFRRRGQQTRTREQHTQNVFSHRFHLSVFVSRLRSGGGGRGSRRGRPRGYGGAIRGRVLRAGSAGASRRGGCTPRPRGSPCT